MATNAVYKIYNGTNGWVDYHLKTNATQVIMTNARKFITSETTVNGQAFSLGQNDNTASVTINGSHITCATVSAESLEYISATDSVAAALGKLDKAAKDAYNHVPADVLTSSNYAQTLGSVYAAIGHNHSGVYQPLDADLTAIAALVGMGFLKRNVINGTGYWEVDNTAYVPTSRSINGKALTGNITLKASDIWYESGNDNLENALWDVIDYAHGKADAKAISYNYTGSYTNIKNSKFNSNANTITISGDEVICTDFANDDVAQYGPSAFKIGDVVYVKELNVPDRWVSNITYDNNNQPTAVEFSILETTKVDLSSYATKGTTLAHYGITDAKIENGVITLGGNTITPLTQHQDLSGRAPNNHASSATTYGLGTADLYGHVKLVSGDLNGKSVVAGVAASQSHTHSQYLTSHQSLAGYATETWVDNNFVRCTASDSAPSNPSTGDIWIDTHN